MLSDVVQVFFVDIELSEQILYSHSLKCVPLIEGRFKTPLHIVFPKK
jgi:hypothetical protein